MIMSLNCYGILFSFFKSLELSPSLEQGHSSDCLEVDAAPPALLQRSLLLVVLKETSEILEFFGDTAFICLFTLKLTEKLISIIILEVCGTKMNSKSEYI